MPKEYRGSLFVVTNVTDDRNLTQREDERVLSTKGLRNPLDDIVFM